MKNIFDRTLGVTLVLLLVAVLFNQRQEIAGAFALLTTYNQSTVGTTTVEYLRWGSASSTSFVVPTSGNDTLEVSVFGTASTTDGQFNISFRTSKDNIDYFPLTFPTTTPTLVNGGDVFNWFPGTTATTGIAFSITPTGAFTNIQITAGTSTSNTSRGAVFIRAGKR